MPVDGSTMMYLIVPLSIGVPTTLLQFSVLIPLEFSCKVKPDEGEGQETMAVFVLVSEIESSGLPGVCTTNSGNQNPPVSEKPPAVIAGPASCCATVPLSEN